MAAMKTPALYRIQNLEGEADQDTLTKIADALGVAVPRKETVLRATGDVQEPRSALDWVRQAGADVEAATRLLEAETHDAERAARAGQQQEAVKRLKRGGGEGRRGA